MRSSEDHNKLKGDELLLDLDHSDKHGNWSHRPRKHSFLPSVLPTLRDSCRLGPL